MTVPVAFLLWAVSIAWLVLVFHYLSQRELREAKNDHLKAQTELVRAQAARLELDMEHLKAHVDAIKLSNAMMQNAACMPPDELGH